MNYHLRVFEDILRAENKNKISSFPDFRRGDTIEVKIKVTDGDKVRFQNFRGVVVQRRNCGTSGETFTVRTVLDGVSVERVFNLFSKFIEGITFIKEGVTRRARLFYLRRGKFKIKNKFVAKSESDSVKNDELSKDDGSVVEENIDSNVKKEDNSDIKKEDDSKK